MTDIDDKSGPEPLQITQKQIYPLILQLQHEITWTGRNFALSILLFLVAANACFTASKRLTKAGSSCCSCGTFRKGKGFCLCQTMTPDIHADMTFGDIVLDWSFVSPSDDLSNPQAESLFLTARPNT